MSIQQTINNGLGAIAAASVVKAQKTNKNAEIAGLQESLKLSQKELASDSTEALIAIKNHEKDYTPEQMQSINDAYDKYITGKAQLNDDEVEQLAQVIDDFRTGPMYNRDVEKMDEVAKGTSKRKLKNRYAAFREHNLRRVESVQIRNAIAQRKARIEALMGGKK